MSRESAGQGCPQLTRTLRQHEEQLAPAVPFHLLWLQLKAWPAARRNIQISPHIPVTQCSHAVHARKPAHSMPAGVSPFAPFAASVVSNTAAVGSEEDQEELQQQLMATVVMMILFAVAAAMTFVSPLATAKKFCTWQNLQSRAASGLCRVGTNLKWNVARMASVKFMRWLVAKAERKLEGHLLPEQLDLLHEVLDGLILELAAGLIAADEPDDTGKSLKWKAARQVSVTSIRWLVAKAERKLEGHLSPEQLELLHEVLDGLILELIAGLITAEEPDNTGKSLT